MTNIAELAGEIAAAMEEYTAEVEDAIPVIVDSAADTLVKEIQSRAPRRTGKYAKGWAVRPLGSDTRSGEGYARLVCNPKHYSRAHLLEHGHAKRGGGRVSGKPHIQPACDQVLPRFEERLTEAMRR